MDKAKKAFALNALRRGSYRWYGRWQAEKRSHLKELKRYYCEDCGTVCRKNETQMDHINPVVPVTGWTNFDDIIDRMYVETDGWQRLCKTCHKEKTAAENALRGDPEKKAKTRKKKK